MKKEKTQQVDDGHFMRASPSFVRIIKAQTVAKNNKTTALTVALFQESSTFFTAVVFILVGMSFKGLLGVLIVLKKKQLCNETTITALTFAFFSPRSGIRSRVVSRARTVCWVLITILLRRRELASFFSAGAMMRVSSCGTESRCSRLHLHLNEVANFRKGTMFFLFYSLFLSPSAVF